MVWWIASGADEEQYKEELPREGRSSCGGGSLDAIGLVDLSPLFSWWLVLFIEQGPGPLPKY